MRELMNLKRQLPLILEEVEFMKIKIAMIGKHLVNIKNMQNASIKYKKD
jgi:hypothetical protein